MCSMGACAGIYRWQIDHIVPTAHSDLRDPSERRACFHWSNLQVLWPWDNAAKGASSQTVRTWRQAPHLERAERARLACLE